jgi:SAM-dependent MidA family methyltransferase
VTATSLQDALQRRIREVGPLSFDEFLTHALYGPFGYYVSHVPGKGADYRTSPSETEWFGRMVLEELENMWRRLDSPDEFTVAEFGAGSGDLAAAGLGAVDGPFDRVLRWRMVEPFEPIAELQRRRLSPIHAPVDWVRSLEELDPFVGAVVANEVLDNFPFRLFEVTTEGAQELGVGLIDGRLSEVPLTTNDSSPEEVGRAVQHLEPGDRFEVRPYLDQWCRSIARTLKSGYLLVFDYGDTEPQLWTLRPAGTLATYHREQLGFNPFTNLGHSDITAHVNFSALERNLSAVGITTCSLTTQREWLKSVGISKVVEDLRAAEKAAAAAGEHAEWIGLVAERSRVEVLDAAGGLGDHRVLIAGTADVGC